MIKILIVEDEAAISDLIQMNLSEKGFICECAYDGAKAADLIEKNNYDLVLLDIMLPEIDGYELLEYIKPLGIPTIFITAKDKTVERVKGLNMGAEDYIVKPFEIIELIARVETVLRRYNKSDKIIKIEDVEINLDSHSVTKNGELAYLTLKEFELLLMLVRNPGIALYRELLFERVWGASFMGETRTLDLHMQRLRKKLGWEDKIKTVYKVGYRLDVRKS